MNNGDKPAMPVLEVGQQMHSGLSKREYLAGLAMQGLLANSEVQSHASKHAAQHVKPAEVDKFVYRVNAEIAVGVTDALLKELEK